MKTPLLLLGLALACALWAPAAEASTIFRTPTSLGLAQGLVGHWTFDGLTVSGTRVFDASGTGNYGTMTSGPRLVNGKLGQGMQFDGVDDYVDAGNGSSLSITGKPRTLSGWVKFDKMDDTTCQKIIYKGNSNQTSVNYSLGKYEFGAQFEFVFTVGGSDTRLISNATLSQGVWYYVTAVYDGTYQKLYINGAYDNQAATTATPDTPTDQLSLGAVAASPLDYFKGRMDDVRIYNRALSADEIKRLYKMGATAKLGVVSNSTSLGKGLVGYWTFDGKDMAGNSTAGEYAFDVSGNGNRGTLTNGPKRVFGKIGQGILFNGGDDYVDAGTPSVLKITGNITISARVKFTSATQNMGVFAYFRINYAEGYMLATSNTAGTLVFSRYGASAKRHYQGLSCTISRR